MSQHYEAAVSKIVHLGCRDADLKDLLWSHARESSDEDRAQASTELTITCCPEANIAIFGQVCLQPDLNAPKRKLNMKDKGRL